MAALRFFFYLLMKPAALGMAFLGLAGVLAPYVNPEKWWIPAFSGLFMPLILIANFFLLIYWGVHKKWWVLLPLVALGSNYKFFVSTFQPPWKPDAAPVSVPTITIASYNVENFYWLAKDSNSISLPRFISDNNIDIFCIQEYCEPAATDSAKMHTLTGLPYRCVFYNHITSWARYGISIYSRFPIVNCGEISFDSEKNSSMWADIRVDHDTIRVINNHLQTTDVSLNKSQYHKYRSVKNWKGQARTLVNVLEQLKKNFRIRARQARLVRRLIDSSPYPVIVCGDFNDTSVSYAYNHITQQGFRDGFIDRGKGYGHSFNGIKGLLRIDFIAYQPYFTGISYQAPHLHWSDHNPVIMVVAKNNR